MRIRLVSHASAILRTKAGGLWTDPWLTGKAFNESWALWPRADFDEALLPDIDWLWISHEHPDHFHIPTLKGLPQSFKERVTVLFQEKNSSKLFDAMRRMGYRNFLALPNRETVTLGPSVSVNCCQIGFIDSVLSVREGEEVIVNVNDADLSDADVRRIVADVGRPRLLLNQFSLAGCDGYADRERVLPRMARQKLEGMLHTHRLFGAESTIPFASFCYFCTVDNRYINGFGNSVESVARAFDEAGQGLTLLYPGDETTVGAPHDNTPALTRFKAAEAERETIVYDTPPAVSAEELRQAFESFCAEMCAHYPAPLVSLIGTIRFRVMDLGTVMTCDFKARRCGFGGGEADIEVFAQPLQFGFIRSFGFETLAVSGRFMVLNNRRRWRILKALSILNNQEIYLHPRQITRRTVDYVLHRLGNGLLDQIRQKRRQRAALSGPT